jgi:hypothetical protein
MNKWVAIKLLALLMVLLFSPTEVFSQLLPPNPPHVDKPGLGIPTHYVQMRGTYLEEGMKGSYKQAFESCKQLAELGVVEPPNDSKPPGDNFTEVAIHSYYTPNFSISYKNFKVYRWNKKCKVESEWEKKAKLVTQSGTCNIDLDKREAVGQCKSIAQDVQKPEEHMVAGTARPISPHLKPGAEKIILGHKCIEMDAAFQSADDAVNLSGCNLAVSEYFLPNWFEHQFMTYRPRSSGINLSSRTKQGENIANDYVATVIDLNRRTGADIYMPHLVGGFKIREISPTPRTGEQYLKSRKPVEKQEPTLSQ